MAKDGNKSGKQDEEERKERPSMASNAQTKDTFCRHVVDKHVLEFYFVI